MEFFCRTVGLLPVKQETHRLALINLDDCIYSTRAGSLEHKKFSAFTFHKLTSSSSVISAVHIELLPLLFIMSSVELLLFSALLLLSSLLLIQE
ncbi:unnamed protein product [Schistosoma margrebowiei]|uniref:Uncharacterized protein n=1 Tax=Schistosoma margrebowiei TaxID=48269 RepID=A0A3P7YSB5_9TREM|nr:unnamed protein product [Schistosoma margrebowiei]